MIYSPPPSTGRRCPRCSLERCLSWSWRLGRWGSPWRRRRRRWSSRAGWTENWECLEIIIESPGWREPALVFHQPRVHDRRSEWEWHGRRSWRKESPRRRSPPLALEAAAAGTTSVFGRDLPAGGNYDPGSFWRDCHFYRCKPGWIFMIFKIMTWTITWRVMSSRRATHMGARKPVEMWMNIHLIIWFARSDLNSEEVLLLRKCLSKNCRIVNEGTSNNLVYSVRFQFKVIQVNPKQRKTRK